MQFMKSMDDSNTDKLNFLDNFIFYFLILCPRSLKKSGKLKNPVKKRSRQLLRINVLIARGESAVSATTGETRVGVSSTATELSLRLSNNFRDVKFDTNYIAACNSHLKQSRAITGLFMVTNRYREMKKKFATRDNLVSRTSTDR